MVNHILASLSQHGVVALGGSRQLPAIAGPWFGRLAESLVAMGHPVAVGCCVGADAAVISALSGAQSLSVFAAFGLSLTPAGMGAASYGRGWCATSAVAEVFAHARAGGKVTQWAGGGIERGLAYRLASRTRAVAQAASAGAIAIFGRPHSTGSQLLLRAAATRGLPCVAVCAGFQPSLLPPLAAGHWRQLSRSTGPLPAAVWVPGQGSLF